MRFSCSNGAWVLAFVAGGWACGSSADEPPSGSGGGGAAGAGGVSDGGAGGTTPAGGSGGIDLDGGGKGGTGGSVCLPVCSEDLHSIVDCTGKVTQTCLGSDGCDTATVKCMNACAAAESARRSIGCEYYAVFMDQLNPSSCFAAFVANTWSTTAKIQVEYDGQKLPIETFAYQPVGVGPSLTYAPLGTAGLPPGKVAILFLSGPNGTPAKDNPVCPKPSAVTSGVMLFNQSGKGKAFRITTDVPVVAYQMNPFGGGSAAVTGASLLIPSSAWGTNYLAIHGYNAGPQATSLNVVAKEPTTVTFLPTKNIAGGGGLPPGSANGEFKVTLSAGEHVQLTQQDSLEGSVIAADKPVGFFAGGRCSQIPINVYACDHVEQMIPPIKALGQEYVGVSHEPRSGEPSRFRVMGVVDDTNLVWSADFGAPVKLMQGQVAEFTTFFPFTVKSQDKNHPFLLMAHMSGGSTNGMNGIGDAESVLLVPPTQYLRSYVFFTDPSYPITNLVVVRAPDENGKFSDVDLDCAGTLTGWKAVGSYEYTRLFLTNGDFESVNTCSTGVHKMHSDGRFGLWVWGWGTPATQSFTSYVSYGYPGGMNVQSINDTVVNPVPK